MVPGPAPAPAQKTDRNTLRGVNTHYAFEVRPSKADWEGRRSLLQKRILTAAGLNPPPPKNPLNPQYYRHITTRFCTIDTVLIETLPGFRLGGNVYTPLKPKSKAPAVLVPHGHWKHGRVENLPEYSVPALAMNLARQGYIVFTYDMIGYNDTNQLPHDFGGNVEELWSYTPLGLQLWNSSRALDFLLSLPSVDANKIAVTGASGGGTQTFLLTAVDDRIKYSAPVNMVSAYMQGGDPCEEAPGLRVDTFNVEIAAMAAPRPMLMVSCTGDWTKHTPEEEFPEVRSVYQFYGDPPTVENVHVNAAHNYNAESREAVYHFLAKHMQPSLTKADLEDYAIGEIHPEDLLVNGSAGTAGWSAEQLFANWKSMSREQAERTKDKDQLRERLRLALNAEFPAKVDSAANGDRVWLTTGTPGNRVECFWHPGKGRPVLMIHPGGIGKALDTALGKRLRKEESPLLVVAPFEPSPDRVRASEGGRNFYSYNLSTAAIQVQDILTALAFLKTHSSGRPQLVGLGAAGIWTLFAAAVSPVQSELLIDLNGFAGTDEDFVESFFVPGIQKAGGLQAALRLTNSVSGFAHFTREVGPSLPDLPLPVPRGRGRR